MIAIYEKIAQEAKDTPEVVKNAPHSTAIRKLDEYYAAHPKTLTLSWRVYQEKKNEKE